MLIELSSKCLDELRNKAKYFQDCGLVHVLDVIATVVKADLADEDRLGEALSQAVFPLEDVPELLKDWHPGSDGLVLDLVHPSLFPLKYGQSRVLPVGKIPMDSCSQWTGCGDICPVPEHVEKNAVFDRDLGLFSADLQPWGSYQWLPSDLKFSNSGSAKIDSYVNNLHRHRHEDLYELLEQAVDKALPLWNECLSFFHNRLRIKVDQVSYEDYRERSLTIADLRAAHVSSEERRDGETSQRDVHDESLGQDEESDENFDRTWFRDNPDKRQISQPDPEKQYLPFSEQCQREDLDRRDLRQDFPEGIQIIFKLANIHLTPEKPQYNGSSWHVEGALNEHICATALFYYDQANIEDSFLEFRQEIDSEGMGMKPPQDEYEPCEDLYGIEQEGPAVQAIGKVLTRRGRILAFPNVMQHRVQPFGLADPSKPGYRKILAMFLVDPHIRILSTSNVPPQQRDWWAEEIRKIEVFAGLPIELFDRIIEEVDDFPIGWDEACNMREALMAERGRAREEFEQALASVSGRVINMQERKLITHPE